jgi:hypothetical protein
MFRAMSAPPAPPVAERVARMMRALHEAVAAQRLGGLLWGNIPVPLMQLIIARITAIRDRFTRLASRVVAGNYVPRRFAPRRQPVVHKPRQPSPFQRRGWLDALLPGAVAAPYRGGLLALFQEPEMVALIQAAPGPMARILRPLCWMLKLKPPEILANPRRPAGAPPPPPPPRYQPPPPPPPPLPGPGNTLGLHPIQLAPPRPDPPKPA